MKEIIKDLTEVLGEAFMEIAVVCAIISIPLTIWAVGCGLFYLLESVL